MTPGIFKVFGVLPDISGEKLVQYGRVFITDTGFYVVEDNRNFFDDLIADGPWDENKRRRWTQLTHSPYLRIESDMPGEKVENYHSDKPKPEAVFDLLDESDKTYKLEVYPGENMWLDGQHLGSNQVESIFRMIRSGQYKLMPK